MSSQATPATPITSASILNSIHSDGDGKFIIVMCGSFEGKFYFNKLKDCSGKLGSVKCILHKNAWCSPTDFESKGGKSKTKVWKRSITHKGKQLLVVLPLLGIEKPIPQSNDADTLSSSVPFLVSPVLAFVKAYRLTGPNDSLSSILFDRVNPTLLGSSLRQLWDFCRSDLVRLGFAYHVRRSDDSHLLFKNILSDLLDAFEKLDLDGKLPAIYCEANNLSLLPSLEPDPVSRQLALNTKAIESLSISVKDTSSGNVQPLVDKVSSSISSGYDSLKALVESAQRIKAEVESSVEAAMKKLSSLKVAAPHRTISDQSIPILQRSTPRVPTSYPDRRLNVIIFGLPEEDSLKKTKEVVDQLLHYITGKSVLWKDAFCLGRRKSTASTSSMVPPPPRPLLVKLCSEWDKRLILSAKHKLKDYDVQNVFLREDLPFDVGQSRAKSRQNRLSRLSHTQPPLFDNESVHGNASVSSSLSGHETNVDNGSDSGSAAGSQS